MQTNFLSGVLFLLVLTSLNSCKKDAEVTLVSSSDKEIVSFSFKKTNNPGLEYDINGEISATKKITLKLSNTNLLTGLVPTIVFKGKSISPDNNTANNFSAATSYTVTAGDNSQAIYQIIIENPFKIQLGTSSVDNGNDITTDALGNVYVAGITAGLLGTAQFGNADFLVIKYDSKGVVQWTTQFGTAGYEVLTSIAVDNSGNIYVAGYTQETYLTTKEDAYFAKLSSQGNLLWSKTLRSANTDGLSNISCDNQGNVFITGYSNGDLFSPSTGAYDFILAKYDASGNKIWDKQFGTNSTDYLLDACVSTTGNILIAGFTAGNFKGANNGTNDIVMAEYNSNGVEMWTKQIGTSFDERAVTIATDLSGNIYIGGRKVESATTDMTFIDKYTSTGNLVWTKESNISATEYLAEIAVDKSGNIVSTGFTEEYNVSPYAECIYYKYDNSGNQLASKIFGTNNYPDRTLGIAVNASGTAFLTGSSGGSLFGTHQGLGDIILVTY